MIVNVLVSQCDCRDALCNQRVPALNAKIWIAVIDKAGCDPVEQVNRLVDVAQQQGSGVRGSRSAIKSSDNFVAVKVFKFDLIGVAMRLNRTSS